MADAGRGPPNKPKINPSKKLRPLPDGERTMLLEAPVGMPAQDSRLLDALSEQYGTHLSLDDTVPRAAPLVVLSRHVQHPPIGQLIAAGVADMRQSGTDPAQYPIAKIVAVSITHGSAVGELNCPDLPFPTADFKKVFFFGNNTENICFDDPRFRELFSSHRRRFNPNDETLRLLLGIDRPKCRYEKPNVYLPPIVFTLEPSDTTAKIGQHDLIRKNLMGLYLYIIRQNPIDKKIFLQKLKVATYDDLNSETGTFITYSIIFRRFHNYIKGDSELRRFMRRSKDPLTVGFFCCRGAHLRQFYKQINIASIPNPHTGLPPLPRIDYAFSTAVLNFPPSTYPRLFVHTMLPIVTPEGLYSNMGQQPLLQRGIRNVFWQSCLYNLFHFFNIISRESADALASVASFQQVRQISTNEFLVSGESTAEAIRILNGLIPPTISRMFVVQRLQILLGIHKILAVLRSVAPGTYVVFVKVYLTEVVPTEPSILSQIGHWVAIARFSNMLMYYVDVQTGEYIYGVNEQFLLDKFQQYAIMDLLYILTDGPYGPDVLNVFDLQLPSPPAAAAAVQPVAAAAAAAASDSESDGGMRRHRHVVSKKRNFKSKTKSNSKSNSKSKTKSKTRTKKIA